MTIRKPVVDVFVGRTHRRRDKKAQALAGQLSQEISEEDSISWSGGNLIQSGLLGFVCGRQYLSRLSLGVCNKEYISKLRASSEAERRDILPKSINKANLVKPISKPCFLSTSFVAILVSMVLIGFITRPKNMIWQVCITLKTAPSWLVPRKVQVQILRTK